MWDLSHICHLHHSSQQHQIPDSLSKASDWTHILIDASWIHFHYTTPETPSLVLRSTIFIFLIFFLLLSIVDLQCIIIFCCTAKWPSHTQLPVLYNWTPLPIHSKCYTLHSWTPNWYTLLPPLSLLATTSLLSMSVICFCFVDKIISATFLDSTYKWYHMFFSFWPTSLSMRISSSIHVAADGIILSFFVAE